MLIKIWAITYDTIKESIRKFTVLTYIILSTLFLLFFLIFVNLDIVEGTITAVKIFGMEDNASVRLDEFLLMFETGFAMTLFYITLFFSIFTVSNILPNMLDKGRADLYLSKPVNRLQLLIGKGLGSFVIVAVSTYYLLFGMWLILSAKLGAVSTEFLYSGLIILFAYLIMYSIIVLLGILIRNSLVSIMVCYFIIILEAILFGILSGIHNNVDVLKVIYWLLPKITKIAESITKVIKDGHIADFTYYFAGGGYGLIIFIIAFLIFKRKDF